MESFATKLAKELERLRAPAAQRDGWTTTAVSIGDSWNAECDRAGVVMITPRGGSYELLARTLTDLGEPWSWNGSQFVIQPR